jgi:hypothetical protein
VVEKDVPVEVQEGPKANGVNRPAKARKPERPKNIPIGLLFLEEKSAKSVNN